MPVVIPERELSFKTALRVIVPVLYLCLIFDVVAGLSLGTNFDRFIENYPYLLIILPGLMGLRGNVFGAMASRLSTALYLGSSEANFRDRYVATNSLFSVWLATMPVLILLFIASIKYPDATAISTAIQIGISSSVISAIVLSLCTTAVVIIAFRKAIDPDSISAPLITSVADLITIPSIIFLILLFEIQISWILALFMGFILLICVFFSIKEKRNWRIYKESLAIVCSLALIQSLTGNILEEFSEVIYLSFFISFAYPAIIDQFGNYSSIVVARTSTKLHLGEIDGFNVKKVMRDIKHIMITTPFIFPFISIVPLLVAYAYFGSIDFNALTFTIFFLSFLLVVFLLLLFSFYVSVLLNMAKIDPDNGGIPLITTIADVIGTIYAIFIAWLFVTF